MPIGKNAIKRVTNNGYSKVETSAPDMEHSVVAKEEAKKEEAKKEETVKAATSKKAPVKKSGTAAVTVKATPKKKSEKKATASEEPKKSLEKEPDLAPVNTLEKVVGKAEDKPQRQGDCYVNIGGELPYYLL